MMNSVESGYSHQRESIYRMMVTMAKEIYGALLANCVHAILRP